MRAYKVTRAGEDYLEGVLRGMDMPDPTGGFEFGGASSPSKEDYLLLAISEKGGRASVRWLIDNGFYDSDTIYSLVRKGYLAR
ncbi:MAG: hypothetical protein ACXABY_34305 [Candidatus Thorarchaeota archaeon]|jgi:hypothetical protein